MAFADDLTIMISGDNQNEVQVLLNKVNETVLRWCNEAELNISEEKTNYLNVSKPK